MDETLHRLFSQQIRLHVLDMIYSAKASHIGSCFSVVDILATLYLDYLHVSPELISSPLRDRCLISKGHSAAAVYATLALKGFFAESELKTFCLPGSSLIGHVSHHVPGVEYSSGSLGHALSVACGLALVEKRESLGYKTVVVMSDGELNEGSVWEGLMFAAHHQLNKLTVIIDDNKIQSLGRSVSILNMGSLEAKLKAFGWKVFVIDGHDFHQIHEALQASSCYAPKCIIANTVKGKGVSFMENNLLWHYKNPDQHFYEQAKEELLCDQLLFKS